MVWRNAVETKSKEIRLFFKTFEWHLNNQFIAVEKYWLRGQKVVELVLTAGKAC